MKRRRPGRGHKKALGGVRADRCFSSIKGVMKCYRLIAKNLHKNELLTTTETPKATEMSVTSL